ncbi:MAG TPA: outer membrane lipoprotein chaperone LolA [Gemmatimonadaceae bacterium]
MHLRRLRVLGLAGALLAPLTVASARPRAQGDLLDRAVAAWAKVKTARATFEQTITNSLTGRTLQASGEFQQQRPGKLSVSFNEPANDRIVADGKHLWLYLPSSAPGQVIRTNLEAEGSGTVDLSAQFLTAPRSRYTITPGAAADVGGRATHIYTLVPKQQGTVHFQSATVWIDDADATIRQFEVTENANVQRRVRMTSLKTNVPVDASAFVFKVPAGVRIVDR